jgi:hypothetical protein
MNTRRFITLFVLNLFCGLIVSQTYQWANSIGSSTTGLEEGNSVAVDLNGNVIIGGEFRGTSDFDPGAGTFTLSPTGNADGFVAKYNNSGIFQWALQYGSAATLARVINLTTDASGDIYVTGVYRGTIDIDPGPAVVNLTATTTYDIFLAKYTAAGALVWGLKIGGNSDDTAGDVLIDNAGNVVLVGYYQNSIDIDPGPAVVTLTNAGSYDSFIAKFNSSNGNFINAWRWGGTGSDRSFGIAEDASGNLIAVGRFTGTANFNPAGTATVITAGAEDGFVVKFSSAGTYSWNATFGSLAGNEECLAAKTDASDNVYITGNFQNTVDFDPSPSTATLTSNGGNDCYLAKFDANGIYQWAFQIGAAGTDIGYDLSIMNNELHACGTFSSLVDFDPSATGTFTLTSAGNTDMFLARYDLSGTFINAVRMGGTASDVPKSVATASNAVYMTGNFNLTADMNPDPVLTNTLVSNGATDIFMAKYFNCTPGSPTVTVNSGSICAGQSFTLNPGGALSYSFTGGNAVVTPSSTTSYTVTGFDANNCTNAAVSTITVNSLPSITVSSTSSVLCIGGSATLTSSGAVSYTWNPMLPANGIITPTVSVTYTVQGSDANGCTNTSVFTQTVDACAGIRERKNIENEFKVYPNPALNFVYVELPAGANIILSNVLGAVVAEMKSKEGKTEINLSDLPKGVYFIQATIANDLYSSRIIKQ